MLKPDQDQLILVGRVGRSHGVLGEVVVIPSSDDPNRLALLRNAWIGPDVSRVQLYEIEASRLHTRKVGTAAIVKFKEFSQREELGKLRGFMVYASEAEIPLAEDELFFHELIGCSVFDLEDRLLGEVVDVVDTGSQALLKMRKGDGEEVQIPYIENFVKKVDEKAKRINIDPIEGLV